MCAECLAVIRASANFSLIRGIMRHGILLACSHPPAPAAICSSSWFHLLSAVPREPRRGCSPRARGQLHGHAGPSSRGTNGGFALWLRQNEAVPSFPLAVHTSPCSTGLFCSTLSHSQPTWAATGAAPHPKALLPLAHLPRL